MRERGVTSFADYGRLIDQDAHEYDLLLDALTINVTKFYRKPETWDALARTHLPALWRAAGGRVRAWSAGGASGEEPYTVAGVLAEAPRAARGAAGPGGGGGGGGAPPAAPPRGGAAGGRRPRPGRARPA